MQVISTNNKHITEVKVLINNKFIGYASLSNLGLGGSEELWDVLTDKQIKELENRLRRIQSIKCPVVTKAWVKHGL